MKLFSLFLLILLTGFSLPLNAKDWKSLQTFTTDKASQPYIIMGKMSEKAKSGKGCVRQMTKKAAKKDADALIMLEVGATGAKGMWFGTSVMHCTGIAVRWAKPGENGITSITEDTAVPFLLQ